MRRECCFRGHSLRSISVRRIWFDADPPRLFGWRSLSRREPASDALCHLVGTARSAPCTDRPLSFVNVHPVLVGKWFTRNSPARPECFCDTRLRETAYTFRAPSVVSRRHHLRGGWTFGAASTPQANIVHPFASTFRKRPRQRPSGSFLARKTGG